jgi:hypothetical protein
LRILCAGAVLLTAIAVAAETTVLFEESFKDKPGAGWTWVKQDEKAWHLKDGAIEFRVTPGQQNVLARTVPDVSGTSSYAVEVTLTNLPQPTKQYEQAGLIWYANGKPGPKFVKEVIDGKVYMFPGKKELTDETVQLRYVVEGRKFRAEYRPGGKGEYLPAFSGNVPGAAKGKLQVALACNGGPEDAEHWVRFSGFRVIGLPLPEPDLTDRAAANDPDFKVQGEYEGELRTRGKYGAQVVAKGGGKFEVYFLPGGLPGAGWDGKTRVKAGASTKDGKTTFNGEGFKGTLGEGMLTGVSAEQPIELKRVERKSKTLGAKPPEGAVVLFDGKNADEWNGGRVVAGNLLYRGTSSKKGVAAGTLHLEFRTPYEPKAGGQGRGNSGVYLLGREIQVLDSFGLEGKNNECGAFYSSAAPAVNMCLPPLVWQTYDVEIKADDRGDLRASVWHNGTKVHTDYPIAKKGAKPASINLQDHGNPVVYRNIWFLPAK